jgi:hypothetical protein
MRNPNETIFAVITSLPDVTTEAANSLSSVLSIKTVADLAESPHFTFAVDLSEAASNPKHVLRRFGIPKTRVVKGFENNPAEAIADPPLSALEGIGKQGEREFAKTLGVKTIRGLALWPWNSAKRPVGGKRL